MAKRTIEIIKFALELLGNDPIDSKEAAKMVKKWIQGMHMKKGALHKELHVPMGKKIPKAKLAKAAKSAKKSGNTKLAKRVNLAKTLSGLRKSGGRRK